MPWDVPVNASASPAKGLRSGDKNAARAPLLAGVRLAESAPSARMSSSHAWLPVHSTAR